MRDTRTLMRVRPLLFRLREAQRVLGLRRLSWTLPRWLVYREYLVLTRDLHARLPDLPVCRGIRWADLGVEDIPRVLAINPALTEVEIRRRRDEGQACVLGWLDGSVVHYRWEAGQAAYLPYLDCTLRLLEGDVYIADAFTAPEARCRGIYSLSSVIALRQAYERGASRLIGLVAPWNTPALRVMRERTGRRVVGTVGCLSLGGWRRHIATGAVLLAARQELVVSPLAERALTCDTLAAAR